MIDIQIFRNAEGRIYGYAISGHHGERGKSIICAGISVLAQTTLRGLGEHLSDKFLEDGMSDAEIDKALEEFIEYRKSYGDLQVKLKVEPDEITDALLETMVIGMYDVKEYIPEKDSFFARLINLFKRSQDDDNDTVQIKEWLV